ncbi:MAG: metal-dependent hydrolase [Planctomycetes bacterium]|nr:metal-dependent hydrolase [Planctomycetota bacterium]
MRYDGRVDNLTHSLCGAALARAGLDRYGRWALPTLVVAANLPDAEAAWNVWDGKAGYLVHHRGMSHGVIGLAVGTIVLAAIVWILCRRSREPASFRRAVLVSGIGVASHFALDWLNTYGVRPWLPFSEQWYYGDVAFIVDPWIWLAFGGGLWLGAPRSLAVELSTHVAILFTTVIVVISAFGGAAPIAVGVVWGGLVTMLGIARWIRRTPFDSRITMRVAWGVLVVYLACLFAGSRVASARALDAARVENARTCASPAPGVPWVFTVAVHTGSEVNAWRVDLARGMTRLVARVATNLDDPRLTLDAMRNTREVAAWRSFARLPIAEFRGDTAYLGDARYRFAGRGADWSELRVPLLSK